MRFLLDLRRRGIGDQAVLRALEEVPRDAFLPAGMAAAAYADHALPIECGQTISQPYVVAYMTEQLELRPHHRVLEIGTGSGFTAAVLGRLTERVLTVDRYKTLVTLAQERMDKLSLRNVIVRQADGSAGLQGEGTFDRILVTAAFNTLPRIYAEQLVSGGIMITPVMGDDGVARMVRLVKSGSRFEREDMFQVPYQPIVPQIAQML